MHPRTRAALLGTDIEVEPPVRIIEPVGYLDMLELQRNARMVLTDSGGMQKEAYLLAVPCVTLRDETEWIETLVGGWNVLAGANAERILTAARRSPPDGKPPAVFGDGKAAQRMVSALETQHPSHR
jgi:UDP-N-acetylglucosamine 2-epimerase